MPSSVVKSQKTALLLDRNPAEKIDHLSFTCKYSVYSVFPTARYQGWTIFLCIMITSNKYLQLYCQILSYKEKAKNPHKIGPTHADAWLSTSICDWIKLSAWLLTNCLRKKTHCIDGMLAFFACFWLYISSDHLCGHYCSSCGTSYYCFFLSTSLWFLPLWQKAVSRICPSAK